MAKILATINVMPEGVEVDFEKLKEEVKKEIEKFGVEFGKVEEEEIAFGLKQLKFIIISDEEKGGLEGLEKKIEGIKDVKHAEVVDVRRAIG